MAKPVRFHPCLSRIDPTAVAGLLGIALNLVAVSVLGPVPHTYAAGDVSAWLDESRAAPMNTMVSAVSFTIGLVLLGAFMAPP